MKKSLQTIILELQNFWAAHGCTIAQPYYTQVGAGTMNPATFLRVLGPEPWNVAYVEPSVRPDDGRIVLWTDSEEMLFLTALDLSVVPVSVEE